MIRLLFILMTIVMASWACGPMMGRSNVYLNKKGVTLKTVPSSLLEKIKKDSRVKDIELSVYMGIPNVILHQSVKTRVLGISTVVDLSQWFIESSCLKSWESFNSCMSERKNSADESLHRKLEQQFVSKILCREKCENPDFAKWVFHWRSPAFMELETNIGSGEGFESVQEAKKSLHNINALLKKVLYGARFPESYDEGHSEYEVYSQNTRIIAPKDSGKVMAKLLKLFKKEDYLHGLNDNDIESIKKLAKGGRSVFYLPSDCPFAEAVPQCSSAHLFQQGDKHRDWCNEATKPGWHSICSGSRIIFDRQHCPHVTLLR